MWYFVSNIIDEISASPFLSPLFPLTMCIAIGNLMTLPGANPIQALCYEEYIMIYISAIVRPVYVLTEERVVPNGMTEVLEAAKMVDRRGGKTEGMCFWTGNARGKRRGVSVDMLMVGVLIIILSLVELV